MYRVHADDSGKSVQQLLNWIIYSVEVIRDFEEFEIPIFFSRAICRRTF